MACLAASELALGEPPGSAASGSLVASSTPPGYLAAEVGVAVELGDGCAGLGAGPGGLRPREVAPVVGGAGDARLERGLGGALRARGDDLDLVGVCVVADAGLLPEAVDLAGHEVTSVVVGARGAESPVARPTPRGPDFTERM